MSGYTIDQFIEWLKCLREDCPEKGKTQVAVRDKANGELVIATASVQRCFPIDVISWGIDPEGDKNTTQVVVVD